MLPYRYMSSAACQCGIAAFTLTMLMLCWSVHTTIANSAGRNASPKLFTAYACENSKLHIMCSEREVIRIRLANYGRFSLHVCNRWGKTDGWTVPCRSHRTIQVVSERCDGRRNCSMMANNHNFGDPCPDTNKYVEVRYLCEKEENPQPPVVPTTTTSPLPTTTSTTTLSTTTKTTSTITPSTSPPKPKTTPHISTAPPSTPHTSAASSIVTTVDIRSSKNSTTKDGPEDTTTGSVVIPNEDKTTVPMPQPTTEIRLFTVCKQVRAEGIWWPITNVGSMAVQPCPDKLRGTSKWLCSRRGWTGAPDLSNCVSPWVEELDKRIDKILQGEGSPENAVDTLENVTEMATIGPGDLKRTTTKLLPKLNQVMVKDTDGLPVYEKREKMKKYNKKIVSTSSNLLSNKQRKSWETLQPTDQTKAATSLMVSMEDSAFNVAAVLPVGSSNYDVTNNIMVEVSVYNTQQGTVNDMKFPSEKAMADSSWQHTSNSLTLPSESLTQASNQGVVQVVFMVYNNIDRYMTPAQQHGQKVGIERLHGDETEDRNSEKDKLEISTNKLAESTIVNTRVISAAINGRQDKIKLAKPIQFTLAHLDDKVATNPTCSYWDLDRSTLQGQWSKDGCRLIKTNKSHTSCECNHLTNFAVLMDVAGTKLGYVHEMSLRVITYVGCIISIVCLLLSWFTFLAFKNLQSDRTTIHKHLVFSLMLAEIIFLTGIGQTEPRILCAIIAGCLHFLFLVAFAWMCLEGVQLYVMLIEVFEKERSRLIWYYLFGYGVPVIVVGVSAGINYEGYGTESHCWLSTERYFIWSFVGPAVGVITVNVIMLSIAIYMMCKHASSATSMKERSNLQKFRAWIKGAVVLVVLLGLTWAFGLMFLNKETVVMAYIFTVLNSLQGVFIFVFHCLMNEKVQKEYRKVARRTAWLPDCIRVNYGGYNGHLSSSPNPSTGSGNYFSKLFHGRRRKRSSSTNSSTRPFLSQRGTRDRRSDGENSTSRESSVYPSTVNGYIYNGNNNNPQKSPKAVANGFSGLAPCYEVGGMAGDLSEFIDCSVVDSEAVTEYCNHNLQVSREKRRYSSGSEDCNQPSDEDEVIDKDRLSALSCDSITKNRESFASTPELGDGTNSDFGDNEMDRLKPRGQLEKEPLVTHSESEKNLINTVLENEYVKINMADKHKGKKQSPSLNNLKNKEEIHTDEKINTSTPNLKYKDSPKKAIKANTPRNEPSLQSSMPNLSGIVEAFENPNYDSHDGDMPLKSLEKNNKVKRLSSDIQSRYDPHRYQLSSSEC